jgi:hypothetical protein
VPVGGFQAVERVDQLKAGLPAFVRTPGGLVQLPDREANPIRHEACRVSHLEIESDGLVPLPAGKGTNDLLATSAALNIVLLSPVL